MLRKTVSPTQVNSGDVVTYTLTITNTGNQIATGLVITDLVPAELATNPDISSSGLTLVPIAGSSYAWTAGNLSPGQSGSIIIRAPLTGAGTVTNSAALSGSNDIYSGDNTAEVGGYICGEAGIVTKANDSGPGSLRDMLASSCFETITFADDTTIHLDSILTISDDVTIDGSGHTVILSGDSGGDGSRDVRVMVISTTASVTLTQLNIVSGTATLGGGIYNLGTVTLLNSTLADNTATYGGGLYTDITASAVLSNSTIANNYASISGGGIDASGVLTLTHVTIANNSAPDFDGTGGLQSSGTLYAYNSILADDSGPFANNCSQARDNIGSIAVNINNLIEGSECNGGTTLSGLLDADPQLGALDYHGGATLNHALAAASPALDSANATYCPASDQRGVSRPQGIDCDRGAFELEQPELTLTKLVAPTHIAPGDWLTYTLSFTNSGAGEATNTVITDDLPIEILNPAYTWNLDGEATLTHTTDTTYSWTISGTLASGQGGVITVTGQLSSPLAAGTLTNTATIAEIQGSNNLSATVAVTLTIDNVAPVVAANVFTIAENAAIGANVGVITGSDANLDVVAYTISGGNSDGIFALNPSSGQVTVTDTTYLNYESDSQYLLTVAATDGDLTGTNTIKINITNTSTDLTLSKAVTPLAAAPGQTITYTLSFTNTGDDKARDVVIFDDGLSHLASLSYESSLAVPVSITHLNSITYVWELDDLAAGSSGTLTLTGILTEPLAAGVLTNTATITTTSADGARGNNSDQAAVTISNVAPVLTPTVLTVSEAATNGTLVGWVDAFDGNGDSLTFTLTGGNLDGVFALNSTMGLITVIDQTKLNFEATPQHVLAVDVDDGVVTGSTVVTINVTPDVTPPDITGMTLLTPTLGITLTNSQPRFDWGDAVDSQSGVISYTLLITSSNNGLSLQEASTAITTTVSEFIPSVDLETGVYTWTVRAHDAAGNASGYVSPPATFNIETGSGEIFLPVIMRNGSPE